MVAPSALMTFKLPFDLILGGVLVAVLVVFAVFSAILFWHWRTYSTGRFTTATNMLLYLGVGTAFVVAMAASTLIYTML
jgi:hypothetical protein